MYYCTLFVFSSIISSVLNHNPLEPLLLSPFIRDGNVEEAQKLAYVEPFLPGVNSYSGYITVDVELRSHLFFWFFTKKENWIAAPLVVWLQGGPAFSSMSALFTENGPYVYKGNGELDRRPFSWTDEFNVIYIDNPVGTGFSFTENTNGYCSDQTKIGENLHEALRQFLILFPQLQRNQLILSGESYAGKYLTSLANTISRKRPETQPPINVFGIFICSPFISPEWMLPHHNDVLYAFGLIDSKGRDALRKREEEILRLIDVKSWTFASLLHMRTVLWFEPLTGLLDMQNIMQDSPPDFGYEEFLKLPSTKVALHVGHYNFNENRELAQQVLASDFSQSFKLEFERMLENEYRVLVFSGQFDVLCPYRLNENLFKHLFWKGTKAYNDNERYKCTWEETVVGYFKQSRNFTHVMVRNATHKVMINQPQRVLGLLKKFVDGTFDNYIQSLDISY